MTNAVSPAYYLGQQPFRSELIATSYRRRRFSVRRFYSRFPVQKSLFSKAFRLKKYIRLKSIRAHFVFFFFFGSVVVLFNFTQEKPYG